MPKMKTHKSSAKRFRVKKSGTVLRSKANKSHILTKKTAKRKRNLRKSATVDSTDMKRVRRALPYAF
jgi:large subunit ribosomal protein L35